MARLGPLACGVRRFTLGWGPPRRTSDTVEFVSRVVVLLVVLLSVPVALAVGTAVRSDLAALARQQADERTQVPAVVTADAAAPADAPPRTRVPVPARWTSPDGTPVEGEVPARPTTRAGDTLVLWTTSDGRPTGAPMTPAGVWRSTLVLVGLGWAGTVVATVLLHVALCRLLASRADRRWAREWARVEPTWSRRVP
ncbi:Rv1733c family protein [Geodermatophilus sp. URMC 60]